MLGVVLLLQLTLWVASIHAFFPWNACEADNTCPGSGRRAVDAESRPMRRVAPPRSKGVTFDLWQRFPVPNEDPAKRATRAARVASRLAQKYAPLGIVRGTPYQPELTGRSNKYSIVTPLAPTESKGAAIYQDASDFSYFIQAKFGAAQKPLFMLLDSGAGTTWIMGSACKSSACTLHDTFGPDDSKTLTLQDKTFSISYGTGKVAGQLAQDAIAVADMSVEMVFGVANETSDEFTHFPFDGILGLSMSSGATDNFMGLLVDKKALDSKVFSVNLGRSADGVNNGQVTFGGVDPAKYTGDIKYTAVSSKGNGDWAIPMDDFSYDGKTAGITGKLAYIDTGTSFVFGPPSDVAALHKLIPGAASSDQVSYTVPCTINADLSVTFSGTTYTLSSKDWITKRDGSCVSNIYGHEVVKDSWLLGDLFLKNVYGVFDAGQKQIGFAAKAPLPDGPKATSTAGVSPSATAGPGSPSTSPLAPAGDGSASAASQSGQASGGAPVSETSAHPSATPAHTSPGDQLESSGYVSIICVVAIMAMVA